MEAQYIKLLKKQINKLDSEEFDLEAWKASTISVLQRIFRPDDLRAKHIDNLRIDYSSWALRDSNSSYKPIATAKLKGKELLQTAIEEIEIFGIKKQVNTEALGDDFAKKMQEISKEERTKYFEGKKKQELVDLLVRLTDK